MRVFSEDYDVGADPFLTPAEFLRHPQMTLNNRVVEIEDPRVGRCRQVGALALFAGTPTAIGRPAPALGEHTAQILAEIDASGGHRARGGAPDGAAPDGAVADGAVAGRADRRPPLDGVTVVELAYYIAGPLAGALLAEMGARVIKVEPVDGDPYRRTGLQATKFLHGKESIAVDLKAPEGLAILHGLVARADVFVHNFRPGVPERLGFGAADLCAANPDLVYVAATSYGSVGPQAGRTAFHSTPNALVGSGIAQAGAGNAPVDDSYPDPGSAIGVATAVLLGIQARRTNGCGQQVETSMLATTGYIMSPWLVEFEAMPERPMPDHGQHGLGPLYRLYRCAAGWVFVGAVQEDEWRSLARALGHADWAADPRFADAEGRRANADELSAMIAEVLAGAAASDWAARCRAAGARVVVAADTDEETWLKDHGLLLPEDHPAYGPHYRPPVKVLFATMGSRLAPPAAIGEHTRPLLTELGMTAVEIDRLVARGVVADGGPAPASAPGASGPAEAAAAGAAATGAAP